MVCLTRAVYLIALFFLCSTELWLFLNAALLSEEQMIPLPFVNPLTFFVLQHSPFFTGAPGTCRSGAASPLTWLFSWTSWWASSIHWRVSVEVSQLCFLSFNCCLFVVFVRFTHVPYPFHYFMMDLTELLEMFRDLQVLLYPSPCAYQ